MQFALCIFGVIFYVNKRFTKFKNYNIIITPWYEEKYKQWTYLINQKRLNSTILYNSKEEAELNGIEFVLKNII